MGMRIHEPRDCDESCTVTDSVSFFPAAVPDAADESVFDENVSGEMEAFLCDRYYCQILKQCFHALNDSMKEKGRKQS